MAEPVSGIRPFGQAAGAPVQAIRIGHGRLSADILTYGAALRGLWHESRPHSLVLGLNSGEDYAAHSPYFGAVVGRVANRLAHGRFALDGRVYQIDRNEKGRHTLHGGKPGFSDRLWSIDSHAADAVSLSLDSAAGENGFPGRVRAQAVWRLRGDATLELDLSAQCDAPTPVNLTAHPYFCLDGAAGIGGHRLQIFAEAYTPADDELIPTGEIAPVAGSRYDFRTPREVGADRFDTNFCIGKQPLDEPRPVARLTAGGLTLDLASNQPGLQFYTGDLIDVPAAGLDGAPYGARAGLCLEPQAYPDAPNHPGFPSIVLRPGERYRHRIVYRFEGEA